VPRYEIDPDRSRVWIDARSNVHPIHSETDGLGGHVDLQFDPHGAIDPSVPPSGRVTLQVARLQSGNRLEDRELQKRIDARRFPSIEGVLESITAGPDPDSYTVAGTVTFRGVSCRHEDFMSIRGIDERTIQLEGSSRFDIRTFGMDPPKILLFRVEPEVDIRVDIYAVDSTGEA
jgi:polyisoprenoid-binding protein YceI